MNSAALASFPNVSLFPICYYISAFSTFFISKDLMTSNEKNQSVPVVNALFEYLNKSNDESLAKSQLLLEVLDKINFYQEDWNGTLDMKDVNETYQYIITASLLHHCGNIRGYISGHTNKKESITFPELRNIIYEALSDKCINNNPCSRVGGTTKLTSLAIEKLLEYIRNAYNQKRISSAISNYFKKGEMTKLKRYKRQPPTYTHNFYNTDNENEREFEYLTNTVSTYDNNQVNVNEFSFDTSNENIDRSHQIATDSELERLIKSKLITDPYEDFHFTVEQRQQLLSRLIDPRDSEDSLNMHGEYFNDQSNDNDFLLHTSEEILDRSQQDAEKILPKTSEIVEHGNKRLNNEKYLHIPKVPRIDTTSTSSAINTDLIDNDSDFDNVPSTSKETRKSIMVQYIISEQKKQASEESLRIGDYGKSKRMLSIEVAANYICSRLPSRDFADTVDTLKGYLLKLEGNDTSVPTYYQFAIEFCNNLGLPSGYNKWKILNGTYIGQPYIDDVLFKAYLDDIVFNDLGKFAAWGFLRRYSIELFKNDLKMYKNSMKLRKSLRVQEFLLLRFNLLHSTTLQTAKKLESIQQMTAVLYRLALRECEEDWPDKNITLYAIDFDSNLSDLRYNSSARSNYTFYKYTEFSTDLSKEISKLGKYGAKCSKVVLYTIKLENQAGIVNVDRLFEANTTGRYIVPVNMTFAIRKAEPIIIGKRKVFSIEMRDERVKEEKMLEVIQKIHNLFKLHYVNGIY